MRSFSKKIKSIAKNGLEPVREGIDNFLSPTIKTEKKALERLEKCLRCPFFKEEPINFLKVEDNLTPKASGKMCDDCGCTISYKIRQSSILCKYWDN